MRTSPLLFILLLLSAAALQAQDTLTLMHYNLLNYGVNTSYCTPQNNEMGAKEAHYRVIFEHAAPDLVTVNEINPYWAYHKRLADSTLEVLWPGKFAYKSGSNSAGDIHANGLFYRKDKLALYSHISLPTSVRDFDVWTMYYKDPLLATQGDTAFFTMIAVHFKAGSTASDEADRLAMAQILTAFLDTFDMRGPVLLAGDYNMKGSNEAAYQALITGANPEKRLADPINLPGNWYNNSSFKAIHTQSTQVNSAGCASGGGLDDRFDIILCSPSLLSSGNHYRYVTGTYKALGNDGQHFNLDINSGTNTSVPATVANALFAASDHLPVLMRIRVDQFGAGTEEPEKQQYIQAISQEGSQLMLSLLSTEAGTLSLIDLQGRVLLQEEFLAESGRLSIDLPHLSNGLYLISVKTDGRTGETRKLYLRR